MSMTAMDPADFKEIAQKDPLCHPGVMSMAEMEYPLPPAPHLRELYGMIYRAVMPQYQQAPKNIMRLYPREHGKSESGTHVSPSWTVMNDPNRRVLIMSETTDQAKGKLQECRETINEIGPRYGLQIETDSAYEITLNRDITTDMPSIKAAGFGSSVTGGHYDLVIFDDLISWDSQRTESRRKKVKSQFKDYLNLGSEGKTAWVVLGTRKHPDDLYNWLMNNNSWNTKVDKAVQDWTVVENGEYDVVAVPDHATPPYDDEDLTRYQAEDIATIPTDHTVIDVEPHRQVETLWPERWPLDSLIHEMLKASSGDDAQGALVWKRENQNDAAALQGQVLSEDMLTFVEPSAVPEGGAIVAGVDLALESDPEKAANNDTDYWSVTVLRKASDGVFMEDQKRKRGMSMQKGVDWLETVLNEYPTNVIYAESNQAQRWFVQAARDEGLTVKETTSTGKKEDRILSMSSQFESGNVKIVDREGKNWGAFVTEWAQFPSGDHDDTLDSTEIALRGVNTANVVKPKITDPHF